MTLTSDRLREVESPDAESVHKLRFKGKCCSVRQLKRMGMRSGLVSSCVVAI